jgi:glyoxylase-like metal-dependent hydrolase (beta-lactamase superfamily II)
VVSLEPVGEVEGDWAAPGIFPLGHGIFRVPLPLPNDGLRAVNVYVIDTEQGLVLVDSGWALPESEQLLSKALSSIGRSLDDIRKFLVTHIHSDHYGQAVALRGRYKASVYLGSGERKSLRRLQGRTTREANQADAALLDRAGAASLAMTVRAAVGPDDPSSRWTDPDCWMNQGDQINVGPHRLTAIATPGHTQGHMVFRQEELQLLFAGDHVLPTITPSIGFEPARSEMPLGSYLDSLTLLLRMDDAVLLPAHGPPGGSVHERVRQLLAHHAQRLERMESVFGSETRTAYEVAALVPWTRRERSLSDLDAFNQMLAVLETDSHLKLLVAAGRLRNDPVGDVDHFSVIEQAGAAIANKLALPIP